MAGTDSLVRVGIVSAVDGAKQRARVYYPDLSDMVSDWLYVLQAPYLLANPVTIGESEGHTHPSSVGARGWMPRVDDKVLTLYTYGENTDGYILGVIP